jgi:alkylation response protein AidB-like acyl-CoA dehydrogenase
MGSGEQKRCYFPKIASGALWLQSMGVTAPTRGTDPPKIKTTAEKKGDRDVITRRCEDKPTWRNGWLGLPRSF